LAIDLDLDVDLDLGVDDVVRWFRLQPGHLEEGCQALRINDYVYVEVQVQDADR
jgi:hypothetical protein